MRRRWLAGAMALVLGLFGCTSGGDPGKSQTTTATTPPAGLSAADEAATSVVKALNSHDLSGVQATRPASEVQTDYEAIFARMDSHYPTATLGEIVYEGNDLAHAKLTMTWALGLDGWEYETTATLRHSDTWRLQWEPSVIHPLLTSESRLKHTHKEAKRASINDLNGQAIVEERPVNQVGLDKANMKADEVGPSARRLAAALGIDAAAYQRKAEAAGAKAFVIAATREPKDIPSSISGIPGLYVRETSTILGPGDGFAAPILGAVGEPSAEAIKKSQGKLSSLDRIGLSGLQSRYDKQLRGVPLVRVDLVGRPAKDKETAVEEETLFQQDASVGAPISISLNRELQSKAESVLKGQSGLATLVVIDVKTGGVLAAAQSPSGGSYPYSTVGAFAPGSTFKVVSSLAMLRQGVTPSSTVQCPSSLAVGGHTFGNYTGYPAAGSGSVPLSTAFKYSCNTTFVQAASSVTGEQLKAAAGSLGVGTDYDSGFRANFGKVEPTGDVDRAASMIGQGQVTMSPLGMASVAASVASGKTVIPWLVKDHSATSTAQPLSKSEATQLQELMKGVVDSGTGKAVKGIMTGAKTGTAEFGKAGKQQTHAWMIAYNGTYAVSAFVEVGDSGGSTAAPLIAQLFR